MSRSGGRDTIHGRFILQADVGYLRNFGNVVPVQVAAGIQRQGFYTSSCWTGPCRSSGAAGRPASNFLIQRNTGAAGWRHMCRHLPPCRRRPHRP